MPESERLQVLRQQRALVLEQLASLDKQIALEAGLVARADPSAAIVVPPPATPLPANPPVTAAKEAAAAALLAELTATESAPETFSKSGCWLAFGAVMLAAGAIVAAIYFFFYR